MKDNSFSMAMDKIVSQHQAECKREAELQARGEMFRQIRRAVVFMFVSAALIFAVVNHKTLTDLLMARMHSQPAAGSVTDQAAAALQGAQQNAAARDKLIDQISK